MSEWISVEDGLPKSEQIVDVLVKYTEGYNRFTDVEYFTDMKNPWIDEDISSFDNVTHWMPRPELPSD